MGRVDHGRGDPQVIVDRLVPIDGTPLERGTLRLVLRENRINGSAGVTLPRLKEALAEHAAPPKGAPPEVPTPVLAEASTPVPIDLLVRTDEAWVHMQPGLIPRVSMSPTLVRDLALVLGDDSVRLVGGVAIELNKDDRRYPKKR
jgi:hypothetical protein